MTRIRGQGKGAKRVLQGFTGRESGQRDAVPAPPDFRYAHHIHAHETPYCSHRAVK